MNINTAKSRRCCILISWSAYAIMPVGKKIWLCSMWTKNEPPDVPLIHSRALLFLFQWLSIHQAICCPCCVCLTICRWDGKSHLPQQSQKRYDYFHMFTSSRCRVSVGQHCKYIISLVILEVQTVLRNYQASRNFLFLSNKKSWWRELNPYSLPLECRKIKAFQTFSLSNFE